MSHYQSFGSLAGIVDGISCLLSAYLDDVERLAAAVTDGTRTSAVVLVGSTLAVLEATAVVVVAYEEMDTVSYAVVLIAKTLAILEAPVLALIAYVGMGRVSYAEVVGTIHIVKYSADVPVLEVELESGSATASKIHRRGDL